MDEIQKILIQAGRKDLAQKYYEKVSVKKQEKISIPIITEDLVKPDEISRITLDLDDIAAILEKKFKGKSRKTEIQSGKNNSIIFDLEKE